MKVGELNGSLCGHGETSPWWNESSALKNAEILAAISGKGAGVSRDERGWIKGRPGSRKPKEMSIYVIAEAGASRPCKIGYAANPERRRFTLSCGNPRGLVLLRAVLVPWPEGCLWLDYVSSVHAYERRLHEEFASSRVRGEWFDVDASLVEAAIERVLV